MIGIFNDCIGRYRDYAPKASGVWLILSAVLVPNVLKYVEKSRQANVKSNAATMLTQIQADYADSQSTNPPTTFPATDYSVGGISVATTGSASDTLAIVTITTSGTDDTYKTEITKFVYVSGKYTATWDANKWTITKAA